MTNKNLPSLKQSTEVALSRANTLMDMADKILAKQSTDLAVDESWMKVLWKWADDNDISDQDLPRNGLVNLTELYLDGYLLTEVPKEISNLVNLTKLSLWGNSFTEIPKEITNLVNLKELQLGQGLLTKLPKEIGNLVNLKELHLGHNQLTELPKEIGNLVNLTKLYLSGNQIAELPKEITNLVLSDFDYRHNPVSSNNPTEELKQWIYQIPDVGL